MDGYNLDGERLIVEPAGKILYQDLNIFKIPNTLPFHCAFKNSTLLSENSLGFL